MGRRILYRQKLLLNLVDQSDVLLSVVRLHKLMFLLMEKMHASYYEFIPSAFGCYSNSLHQDQNTLLDSNYLSLTKGETPFDSFLTTSHTSLLSKEYTLKADDEHVLSSLLHTYKHVDDDNLIELIHNEVPFYGIRSQILHRFDENASLEKRINNEQSSVKNSLRGLYTIGYEGMTIDGFLQQLIKHNVKILVDVRKNAFSMRLEFRKRAFIEALTKAGIKYRSLPEVGIPSHKRKELATVGRQEELFDWYKKVVLPNNDEAVRIIGSLVDKENVALMCFEKEYFNCHRSYFAEYCRELTPTIKHVYHL
ncbi:MAG: DUF488 domain-containing protein [Sphaerochaetaceae bacterium]|jgi:hypothetical protein